MTFLVSEFMDHTKHIDHNVFMRRVKNNRVDSGLVKKLGQRFEVESAQREIAKSI